MQGAGGHSKTGKAVNSQWSAESVPVGSDGTAGNDSEPKPKSSHQNQLWGKEGIDTSGIEISGFASYKNWQGKYDLFYLLDNFKG